MNTENIIYGLIDKTTQELRYIGKSVSGIERPREHFKPCNLKGNSYKQNWIKKCLAEGNKPEIIIIESFDNPETLFEAEIFYIAYFRGLGCKLTNLTDGGEGNIGWHPSEETLKKQSEAALKRDKSSYQNPHNKKEHKVIDGEKYRNCTKCKQDKQLFCYSKRVKEKNALQIYCKSCNTVINEEWREKNPTPTLSEENYNKSRLPGAIAGGESSKTPERRKQASEQRSKAIRAIHIETGEILKFESALKAKEAGFQNSNIGVAIKKGKPYKKYIWLFD